MAELGYKEMQFAGYYGRSPQQVRDLLQQLGLSSPAAHVSLGLIREDLEKQIDIAKEIMKTINIELKFISYGSSSKK